MSLEMSLAVFILMVSKEGGVFFACPPLTFSLLRRFMACVKVLMMLRDEAPTCLPSVSAEEKEEGGRVSFIFALTFSVPSRLLTCGFALVMLREENPCLLSLASAERERRGLERACGHFVLLTKACSLTVFSFRFPVLAGGWRGVSKRTVPLQRDPRTTPVSKMPLGGGDAGSGGVAT